MTEMGETLFIAIIYKPAYYATYSGRWTGGSEREGRERWSTMKSKFKTQYAVPVYTSHLCENCVVDITKLDVRLVSFMHPNPTKTDK